MECEFSSASSLFASWSFSVCAVVALVEALEPTFCRVAIVILARMRCVDVLLWLMLELSLQKAKTTLESFVLNRFR